MNAEEQRQTAENAEVEPRAEHGRKHAPAEARDHEDERLPVAAVGYLQMRLLIGLAPQPEHRRPEPDP